MIRNDNELLDCLKRLRQDEKFIAHQRKYFKETGLTEVQIKKAIEPIVCFHQQLIDEIDLYKKIKRREFDNTQNFTGLGRLLIALRIANGLSQQALAAKLDVSPAQISRDERNEYRGITLERAQRVLNALNEELSISVNPKRKRISA
jgi:DNA-binding XRE family transcriptional regulator